MQQGRGKQSPPRPRTFFFCDCSRATAASGSHAGAPFRAQSCPASARASAGRRRLARKATEEAAVAALAAAAAAARGVGATTAAAAAAATPVYTSEWSARRSLARALSLPPPLALRSACLPGCCCRPPSPSPASNFRSRKKTFRAAGQAAKRAQQLRRAPPYPQGYASRASLTCGEFFQPCAAAGARARLAGAPLTASFQYGTVGPSACARRLPPRSPPLAPGFLGARNTLPRARTRCALAPAGDGHPARRFSSTHRGETNK